MRLLDLPIDGFQRKQVVFNILLIWRAHGEKFSNDNFKANTMKKWKRRETKTNNREFFFLILFPWVKFWQTRTHSFLCLSWQLIWFFFSFFYISWLFVYIWKWPCTAKMKMRKIPTNKQTNNERNMWLYSFIWNNNAKQKTSTVDMNATTILGWLYQSKSHSIENIFKIEWQSLLSIDFSILQLAMVWTTKLVK